MTNALLIDTEAADVLKLTPKQVNRLARRGELPAVHLPGNHLRFDLDDLRRWIEAHKRPTGRGTT